MTHEPPTADQTIAEIVERLSARFPDYPSSVVREVVTQAYEELNDAHVRDFVEVLVEKQSKKRLKHLDATGTSSAAQWPSEAASATASDAASAPES
jgi:hypothetical protein